MADGIHDVKVLIYKDERYPDYSIAPAEDDDFLCVDVPEELLKRLEAADREYQAVQEELENAYREQSRRIREATDG